MVLPSFRNLPKSIPPRFFNRVCHERPLQIRKKRHLRMQTLCPMRGTKNFPRIDLRLIGGIFRWYLEFRRGTKNGQTVLYPVIYCDQKPKIRLRTFFNVLKKDGSFGFLKRENTWIRKFNRYKPLGKPFDVSELLNPENEYLDDEGSLSIEYGIHVDAILDESKMWKFNLHDIVFNYTGEENKMVKCSHRIVNYNRSEFYCSIEILNFHCPWFAEQTEKLLSVGIYPYDFFKCLQILHGVRLQINYGNYFNVLKIARSFNLPNVIQYCDRPFIKGSSGFSAKESLSFSQAVNYNMRHILAAKLKDLGWEDVVKTAKELNSRNASGEVTKTFVAQILYN